MAAPEAFDRTAQRRVEYWTLGLGAAGALAAGWLWGWAQSGGLAAGALLSWVNFRWLKQGVVGVVAAVAGQAGATKIRIPKSLYAKLIGRYALLALPLYAILTGLRWPVKAFLCGLFALVAAVLVELVYELALVWRRADPV